MESRSFTSLRFVQDDIAVILKKAIDPATVILSVSEGSPAHTSREKAGYLLRKLFEAGGLIRKLSDLPKKA